MVSKKGQTLSIFDKVTRDYGSLPYMTEQKASYLRGLITEHRVRDVLELGFNAIEVSDGTIRMDRKDKLGLIKRGRDMGFTVFSEIGKKWPVEDRRYSINERVDNALEELDSGSFKVIVEAREAGKGVDIFDKNGKVKEDDVTEIIAGVDNPDSLLWEAPIKNQQHFLIMKLGTNVSLGNIPPGDILALEALRQGLRDDTLKKAYREGK